MGVVAFSGSLRGWELVPAKWRCLVPPRRIEPVEITSPHQGATRYPVGAYPPGADAIPLGQNALGADDANRWAATVKCEEED